MPAKVQGQGPCRLSARLEGQAGPVTLPLRRFLVRAAFHQHRMDAPFAGFSQGDVQASVGVRAPRYGNLARDTRTGPGNFDLPSSGRYSAVEHSNGQRLPV